MKKFLDNLLVTIFYAVVLFSIGTLGSACCEVMFFSNEGIVARIFCGFAVLICLAYFVVFDILFYGALVDLFTGKDYEKDTNELIDDSEGIKK